MRRTISGVLLAIFLLTVIPLAGARTAEAADYSNVRVLLSIGSVNALTIPMSGNYFLQENGASFKGGTLTVQVSGSKLVVSHSSKGEIYRGSSVQIMRENIDPSAGYFRLATSGVTRTFLGHLTLKYSGGKIRAINTVPLPHYLYGVVAYEMSNTFPAEALKAQAVAAKCYVLANMTGSSDYDIGDTASDQVYKGYNSSYTYVMNAVDATYNVGLYLGSKILCSYFAASNGGATILPSDAWGGSNRFQWDKAYDRREDPHDVANPYSVQETVFFPASGESGMTAALSNYLRVRAGMVLQGAGYIDGGSVVVAINSIDDFEIKSGSTAEIAMSVIVQLSDGSQTAINFKYSFDLNELVWNGIMTKPSLRLFTITSTKKGYNVTRGRYGHGVGLSQRGAQQMANSGWNYEKILKFYYPGATIKSMGVSAPTNPNKPDDTTQPGGSDLGTPIATAVTTANVNFRAKASASSTLIGTLPKGLDLNVYAQENGFSLTEVSGVAGYVSNSYLKITPVSGGNVPEPPESEPDGNKVVAYGVVNSSTLNFRDQPTTSGKILARLTKGNVVNIYGYVQNSTWYYCNSNGVDGYVSAQYVTLTGTPDTSDSPGKPNNNSTPVITPETAAPVSGTIGTVIQSEIAIRSNPSSSRGTVVATLKRNTQVAVVGQSGSYYAVQVNNLQGYVHKDSLTLSSGNSSNNSGGTGGSNTGTVGGSGTTTASVNFRKGPGTSYDSIKMLSKGTKLTVLALENGWYKVDVNGTTGYISKAYVTLDDSASPTTGGSTDTVTGTGTTTGSVNFRKGPGTSYASIKMLSKGTKLTIYSLESGWYKVDVNGTTGYVSKDFVKLDSGSSGGTGSTTWVGEVYREWVRMRSTPDLSSQNNVIGDYDVGTRVTIIAQTTNGFYQVVVNGVTGYMHKDYVKIVGETEAASTAAGTTTANVYLRAKASSTGTVLTTIPKGSTLSILGSSGVYYHAQYGSLTGYLVQRYVSVR